MTPSWPRDPSLQGRLEEVLREYMQRLDRGEAVDREQLLARHPELADGLRSYFADSDEVERLGRRAGAAGTRAAGPSPPHGPAHGVDPLARDDPLRGCPGPAHSLCPPRAAGAPSGEGRAR